jgi:DNA-binding MarR family transcriptional regulator
MCPESPTSELSLKQVRALIRERHIEEGFIQSRDVLVRMEIMFNLMRLSTRLVRDFESVHRPLGGTWAGFRILNLLWAAGDLEPSELARLTGSSRASISSALNTLEALGQVTRQTRPTNRRSVRVSLTDKGYEALHVAMIEQADRERAWLDALTPDERGTLKDLIGRLHDQGPPE